MKKGHVFIILCQYLERFFCCRENNCFHPFLDHHVPRRHDVLLAEDGAENHDSGWELCVHDVRHIHGVLTWH